MVVTDLHGDWATYLRLRELFFHHRAQGEADRLVLCGDVVHAPPHIQPDRSYDILQDILMLRQMYGDACITVLCGNHEMPHIYDLVFTRDNQHLPLNAPLEQRISQHDRDGSARFRRPQLHVFLLQMPFYLTTDAGVMLSHAGAPPFAGENGWYDALRVFDHQALIDRGSDRLQAFTLWRFWRDRAYREQAQQLLAVEDEKDPRFFNLLRGRLLMEHEPLMRLLWDALFLRNEYGYPLAQYLRDVALMLEQASRHTPVPQRFLVAGHVVVDEGQVALGEQKLRFASGVHAKPVSQAVYLLFDAAEPIADMPQLVSKLRRVWG
jgi:hypothetical protein